MNSNPSSKPKGFEMFFQKGRVPAQNLALSVAKSMTEYNVINTRPNNVKSTAQGKYGRFYIDDMVCPSILIEVAFISNLEDCILVERNVDRIAESIAHGILEHIRSL